MDECDDVVEGVSVVDRGRESGRARSQVPEVAQFQQSVEKHSACQTASKVQHACGCQVAAPTKVLLTIEVSFS